MTDRLLFDVLGPLEGTEIPGGCPQCEAHQTVKATTVTCWTITIHHDPGCPRLSGAGS